MSTDTVRNTYLGSRWRGKNIDLIWGGKWETRWGDTRWEGIFSIIFFCIPLFNFLSFTNRFAFPQMPNLSRFVTGFSVSSWAPLTWESCFPFSLPTHELLGKTLGFYGPCERFWWNLTLLPFRTRPCRYPICVHTVSVRGQGRGSSEIRGGARTGSECYAASIPSYSHKFTFVAHRHRSRTVNLLTILPTYSRYEQNGLSQRLLTDFCFRWAMRDVYRALQKSARACAQVDEEPTIDLIGVSGRVFKNFLGPDKVGQGTFGKVATTKLGCPNKRINK